jgi:hypothetical protein
MTFGIKLRKPPSDGLREITWCSSYLVVESEQKAGDSDFGRLTASFHLFFFFCALAPSGLKLKRLAVRWMNGCRCDPLQPRFAGIEMKAEPSSLFLAGHNQRFPKDRSCSKFIIKEAPLSQGCDSEAVSLLEFLAKSAAYRETDGYLT